MPQLNEDGLAVDLGTVVIRTPGLRGEVTLHEPASPGARGAEISSTDFQESLATAGMSQGITLEITEQHETTPSTGSRAAGGSDDMVLEVRDPGESFGQVLLYEAEDGTLSWHYPEGLETQAGLARGAGTLTYRVPRSVVVADIGDGHRGILGAVGKKILKVLVFRIVDEASQYVGDKLARRFEAAHRPHRLRWFTPDNYTGPVTESLDAGALAHLTEGRALLFVHGTASTSSNGFGQIPRDVLVELYRRYNGRVLAFDHPTVSVDPRENVDWLNKQVQGIGDRQLEVDIVAHSRGGLVSRTLTEHPELAEGRLQVNRLVMVATPNAGTALADSARIGQLLNRLTSLLQLVPTNGVIDALEVILAVVQQVAIGAFRGLDGIRAMDPHGEYLTSFLNQPSACSTRYFGVAANYEPPSGSPLLRVARDGATDVIFGNTDNDLVVPTEGVFTVPGASSFPIANPLVFDANAGVDHSSYWTRPPFTKCLLSDWLSEPAP
jgi:PGAP1-like protein